MKLKYLVPTLGLVIASPAVAAPLYEVSYGKDAIVLLDLGTVRTLPTGHKTIWWERVPGEPEGGTDHMVAQSEFDCVADTFRIIYAVNYDGSGKTLESRNAATEWRPNVPGSVSDLQAELVCGRAKPDPKRLLDWDLKTGAEKARELFTSKKAHD